MHATYRIFLLKIRRGLRKLRSLELSRKCSTKNFKKERVEKIGDISSENPQKIQRIEFSLQVQLEVELQLQQ